MDFIPYDDLTDIQQQIISYKLQNPRLVWKDWMDKVQSDISISFTPLTLGRFVKKTALGLPWEPNSKGGRNPFLCPTDLNTLKEEAIDRCQAGTNFIELDEFLELALEIKISRMLLAARFLKTINCDKFASHLNAEEELEPSRQWVNITVQNLGLSLELPSTIEEERFDAASKNLIKRFFHIYKQLIENCPRALLFGADETMLKAIMRKKVISNSTHDNLLRKDSDIPHITGMCCHNVNGRSPPPFIILPNSLQNLPTELTEFECDGMAWFASSKSGWMNRDLFLVWTVNFLNWLSRYRLELHSSIRSSRALLVLDGHGSRECPLALKMLHDHGVDVLTLPAHTTHITQMFDVCLAAPLKKEFAKTMQKLIKEHPMPVEEATQVARLRYYAISAFISSWQTVCNFKLCRKAARKTGWFPFDEDAAASSQFAVERTDEQDNVYLMRRQARTRLDINARVINEDDFIATITQSLAVHPHLNHLTTSPVPQGAPWRSFCLAVCSRRLRNNSYYLSRIPAFVDRNGVMNYFA